MAAAKGAAAMGMVGETPECGNGIAMKIQNLQAEANPNHTELVQPPQDERQSWSQFSATHLAKAYGDNEPEYGVDDLWS
jgi:hypothetical protein